MTKSHGRLKKKRKRLARYHDSIKPIYGQPIAGKEHGKWETYNKCGCTCEKCFQAKQAHNRNKYGA